MENMAVTRLLTVPVRLAMAMRGSSAMDCSADTVGWAGGSACIEVLVDIVMGGGVGKLR